MIKIKIIDFINKYIKVITLLLEYSHLNFVVSLNPDFQINLLHFIKMNFFQSNLFFLILQEFLSRIMYFLKLIQLDLLILQYILQFHMNK